VERIMLVTRLNAKSTRTPYPIFAIGLDQLYTMPLDDDEDISSRSLVIDRYIDSNGWTWSAIIEESEKPEVGLN